MDFIGWVALHARKEGLSEWRESGKRARRGRLSKWLGDGGECRPPARMTRLSGHAASEGDDGLLVNVGETTKGKPSKWFLSPSGWK